MTPTVILLDIDGTLLSAHGAGRRALNAAFEEHFNRPDALDAISFAGQTDRAILRAALATLEIDADEFALDPVIDSYLVALERELAQPDSIRVLDGVLQLIDALELAPRCALGLGTGNLQTSAYAKLEAVGLAARFAFGGFGSDAEDRGEMLAHGHRRGAARLGQDPQQCELVVVGDTPRDVEAARRVASSTARTRAIAVATGPYSVTELESTGADVVLADFAAKDSWKQVLDR